MASNFQKFMATAEKHAVAGSSKLKATIAGHIYNIQIEEDLDNGSIVAKGDYIKPETYKAKILLVLKVKCLIKQLMVIGM